MATFSTRVDENVGDIGYIGTTPDANSSLSLGNPGAVTRSTALRFTNVTIPQGAVITTAYLKFRSTSTKSGLAVRMRIMGVDEDNTAQQVTSPEDTARTRTHTTAFADWDFSSQTSGTDLQTSVITSIVQEIVDRGGWSSGNAMGFWVADDGSASGDYVDIQEYNVDSANAPLLYIEYTAESESPSLSPSASISLSPSSSASPSASVSPSPSASESASASPSPADTGISLRVAKPGYDALTTNNPTHYIFHSDYGTLKYYTKETAQVTFDASSGDIAGTDTITHNLGYYPFVEVYVSAYIGTPSGTYEYCPFRGSGATVAYRAEYKITSTTIELYAEINGVSSSVWVFDFLVFVYKNNLNL